MADATWPTTLPIRPSARSFNEQEEPNIARTNMDVGPPKVRRRATAAINRLELTYIMDSQQVEIMKDFIHFTLNDGAEFFDFFHPRTEVFIEVRLIEPPRITYAGFDRYNVSIILEELPCP